MNGRSEVAVGVVIITGLILIVAGTIFMRGIGLGREERVVEARFREVGQLQTGNPVKLRGVPVGRVHDIYLEFRGIGVIVEMRIAQDVQLPEDPVVILSPESMFGDWQAEIFPRTRFPVYSYAESSDPSVLPGYSLPDLSRMTAVAERIAENIAVITDRVDIAFTEETALNIRQAVENIQSVTSQLTGLVQAQERTVDEVAAQLEATSQTLSNAAEAARRTFAQIESAIAEGELESIVDNIEGITGELESLVVTLNQMSQDLSTAVASADTAFASLETVAGVVERGEGTLGKLLADTALYDELVLTSRLVQDLLFDFQRNPRKYINLTVF